MEGAAGPRRLPLSSASQGAQTGGGAFDRLRPVALVGAVYMVATLVWVVSGADLPGGRWLALHLFTLGVVTNLVLGLTDHFSRTLLHRPGEMPWWQLPLANAGIVTVLVGVPSGSRWLVVAGATGLTVIVFGSYLRLRTMRHGAVGPRFAWVVRIYERAHGAFFHGAVLGALIGAAVLTGPWAGSARLAHLHVNLLGWAGLTVLATIVFFGPTIARTRIVQGSDVAAARALRIGAIALTVGVLALLATGFGGAWGMAFRIMAAVGLGAFAWSVTVVCVPVARAMRHSRSPNRWAVLAVAAWFPLVAWGDVAMVATGSWRWLDPLGAAMILGVLAQVIVASLGYLVPNLTRRRSAREVVRRRAEAMMPAQVIAWNAGVVLVIAAGVAGPTAGGAWATVAKAGWGLVLATVFARAVSVGSALLPLPRHAEHD